MKAASLAGSVTGPSGMLDGDAKIGGGDERGKQVVADPAMEGHRASRPGKPLQPGAALALPEHVEPEVGIPDPLDGLDHGCEVAGAVEHAAGQQDAVIGRQPEAASGIGLVAGREASPIHAGPGHGDALGIAHASAGRWSP